MVARPGQSLRAFAQRRRRQAGLLLGLAVLCLSAPLWLPLVWDWLLGRSLTIAWWGWLICILPALVCGQQIRLWWRQASAAEQGAEQAESVADRLIPLQYLGWQANYGIREPYAGTTDILLTSPAGFAYAIDVKTHRGRVGSNGRQIYRVTSRGRSPFERDFVTLARRQATTLKKRRKLPTVTPIVTFTNSIVDVNPNPVAGVHIVAVDALYEYLQQLEAIALAANESDASNDTNQSVDP
ncbi:MAG: NERD domain-containing protein [Synechococcales cyanobacterium T60_A2020_003]|nr:NERD domain-containing protein [Synechococcales cyanobacterium T60_A2020_003]